VSLFIYPDMETNSSQLIRKTFAIISHPDAGKTTLTEKFLLFGGAIKTAGAVKSNKASQSAASDFMEIEKQRGISVATSVMGLVYKGIKLNLLDTPGHKDFSEDTYRTLTAVDSVILVIDSAKGVEEQTHKLMEVCRMRDTPVMIFINKMDRPGKDPYDLLDELEKSLSIQVRPLTWPINNGRDFKGVYNLYGKNLNLFSPNKKGISKDIISIQDLSDNILDHWIGRDAAQLREDVTLIEGVYPKFEENEYLKGKVAPVFFGSALNNFGVQELLDTFVQFAPLPQKRAITTGEIYPDEADFSGFVFKIHANLDPRHRDRIVFLRVVSGHFRRNQLYTHVRMGRKLRFSNPTNFLANEKELIDDAFPGDVIGLYDSGNFKIGDTLTEGDTFHFKGIPSFSPELFREVSNKDPLKTKQLEKGLDQLTDEGVAQLFVKELGARKIIGTVGELQFEVIQYRLFHEYGASCEFLKLPLYKACWIRSSDPESLQVFMDRKNNSIAMDKDGSPVFLAESKAVLQATMDSYPRIEFLFSSEMVKVED
jgi:peptide chain release factor 3